MESNKKVLFDPGYAPIVIDYIGQVAYYCYAFSAIKDIKLKRINFPIVFKKIEECLEKNVAFYLGCLMWASYIKKFENTEIEGNKLLGEKCNEEEYTSEINFLIDTIEKQLPRDCKYFLNKPYNCNKKFLPILKAYKEFLILNNGFINCSNTNQIKLPECLKRPDNIEILNEKIQKAIENKDISLLLEDFNLIF